MGASSSSSSLSSAEASKRLYKQHVEKIENARTLLLKIVKARGRSYTIAREMVDKERVLPLDIGESDSKKQRKYHASLRELRRLRIQLEQERSNMRSHTASLTDISQNGKSLAIETGLEAALGWIDGCNPHDFVFAEYLGRPVTREMRTAIKDKLDETQLKMQATLRNM
jgi:hypothetical protein